MLAGKYQFNATRHGQKTTQQRQFTAHPGAKRFRYEISLDDPRALGHRRVMKLQALCFLCALSIPVSAAAQMSAEAFDQYTKGKTLFYVENGQTYGAEEYLPGRRVRWSFLDGECSEGVWYEDAGGICFVYENNPEPQCWSFQKGPRELIADFIGGDDQVLYEAQDTGEAMMCLGPEVGV